MLDYDDEDFDDHDEQEEIDKDLDDGDDDNLEFNYLTQNCLYLVCVD